MDFLKILKSLEEFVYEALIWLVLLPQTLVRILMYPRRMAAYAERELASDDEQRFGDAISPPLLLILCVLIAHLVDLAIRTPAPMEGNSLANAILSSEQNLLLYRTVAFGVWALAGAGWFLGGHRLDFNRTRLRGPFYEQCYLVAPFALGQSIGTSMALIGGAMRVYGVAVVLAVTVWFWLVQIDWVRHRAGFRLRTSVLAATATLVTGALVNTALGYVLLHVSAGP